DGRDVPGRADPGRGDVFTGSIRPRLDPDDRGETMTLRRRLWMAALVVVLAGVGWLRLGPIPARLLDLHDAESTVIVDRNGEVLYESGSADGARMSWMTADQLPPALVDATIAAEDRRFLEHPGVDPIAVVRALTRNARSRKWAEGGSTITQQVA